MEHKETTKWFEFSDLDKDLFAVGQMEDLAQPP
jgi:hypothetical protein